MQAKITGALIALLAFSSGGWCSLASEDGRRPRLLLFITVDQLRYDYLERLKKHFSGGLARLMQEGLSFDQAFQAHAVTTTGPGHASLATGFYPGRSGIVDNQWYDREAGATVNCVEDREVQVLGTSLTGRSPRNLLVQTLADRIKAAYPKAKAYAASRKDRSAILPAGHRADGAFWYDYDSGRFVTSSYYMDGYPDWMQRFHESWQPERFFTEVWDWTPATEALSGRGGFENLDRGAFREGFPKALGRLSLQPDERFFADFGNSPLMDRYLAEFVKSLLVGEDLGGDNDLDFLGVSFSALDSVGHEYGPHSPEVLDTLLRLDTVLGELLEFIDRRVGKQRVVVAFSSDHGVVPLPEYQASRQRPGARVTTSDIICIRRAAGVLNQRYGAGPWFLTGLYLDHKAIERRNLQRSEVTATLAGSLLSCPPVRKVWTASQLSARGPASDPYWQLYRNSFHPARSPDLLLQWQEYWLGYSGRGTSHGSPYEYDRHIPLIMVLPGVAPRRIQDAVETVDLVPTLCSWLGLPVDDDWDGRDRTPLLQLSRPAVVDAQPGS